MAPHDWPAPVAVPVMASFDERVVSVDIARGVVVALMVFVNYLAAVPGVPAWTQHLPLSVDGYSVADLVFPAFLFLVGVSLPLSLRRYTQHGLARRAFGRILPRAGGLLFFGVVLVNEPGTDPVATGMSHALWLTLTLTAAAIILTVRAPADRPRWRRAQKVAKVVCAVLLVYLIVIWRGNAGGTGLGPMRTYWWGILGLIGWSYLVAAIAFLATRGNRSALMGVMALMICVALASWQGRATLGPLAQWIDVRAAFGSLSAIVVAGSVAGLVLLRPSRGRLLHLVLFGLGLWAAGWLLRPLHGYHKDSASEAWALVAAGQTALLLALCHAAFDGPRRLHEPVSGWLALAGSNALLAYIVPDWFTAVAKLWGGHPMVFASQGGVAAVANSALLTAIVIGAVAYAAHARVTLRL